MIDLRGDVAETKDIESAEDAHAWFADSAGNYHELGWRMEVEHAGEWSFFDSSEGSPDQVAHPIFRANVTASSDAVPRLLQRSM